MNTALDARDLLPGLVGGEAHDRGQQLAQALGQFPTGGSATAAAPGIEGIAVEAILDDLEVAARELQLAEAMDGLGGAVELEARVGIAGF